MLKQQVSVLPQSGRLGSSTHRIAAQCLFPLTKVRLYNTSLMDEFVFNSRRSVVHSSKGISAASQPLAAAAGIQILEKGGNAADASIAVAAAMGVTEPTMSGIGGDVFCLYYDAKTKAVTGFNGSGKSAKNLTLEEVKNKTRHGRLSTKSPLTVNVPGAAAGWVDIVDRLGSGKVSMGDILAPAIDLARNGFPVSEISSWLWTAGVSKLRRASPNAEELLIDGKAPKPGQMFYNPHLAEVYERLANDGKAGFYEGPTADAIIEIVGKLGGKLSHEDLKSHSSLWLEPLTMPVDDKVTIYELPPNNHGLVVLVALGIINELEKSGKVDKSKLSHNSVEYCHLLVESLKFAFKDADHYVGDPEQQDFDPKQLLSSHFLKSRTALYSNTNVNMEYEHGTIDPRQGSDTSYFTVTDSEGNACSVIGSVYHSFGSGIIPKDTGFPLHNRGSNFSLKEGTRNVFDGGKRPYHTIIPGMLLSGDELYASFGIVGAFMQPQAQIQVAYNMCLFGMDPQEALNAPRICITPEVGSGMPKDGIIVKLEDGFPKEVAKGLQELGHRVKIVSGEKRAIFGRGQVIQQSLQHGRPVYHAGSDPRGDGQAVPQI